MACNRITSYSFPFLFKVISSAAYLYDAVWLYAIALNRSIEKGVSLTNRSAISSQMTKTEFEGKKHQTTTIFFLPWMILLREAGSEVCSRKTLSTERY